MDEQPRNTKKQLHIYWEKKKKSACKWIRPVLTHVVQGLTVFLFAEFTYQNVTNNYKPVLAGIPNIISQLPLRASSSLTQSAQIQACYA